MLSPAGGGPFAGDFVVSALRDDGRRLELALVDVSGKGVDAGTRALLLSGALGGLLGSVRPDGFLPAANRYLDRQEWDEGFATAVHLVLDLVDGQLLGRVGRPPAGGALRRRLRPVDAARRPRAWRSGCCPRSRYDAVTGRLRPR